MTSGRKWAYGREVMRCISTSESGDDLYLLIAVAPNEDAPDEPVDAADGRPER